MLLTIIDFDKYFNEISICMEELIKIINSTIIPVNLGYGITSFGYLLQMLNKKCDQYNEYLVFINAYLEEVGRFCISKQESIISNDDYNKKLDYIYGYMGLLNYVLIYSKDISLKSKIIKWIFKSLNIEVLETKMINVNLGIAHGLSSVMIIVSNVNRNILCGADEEKISIFEDQLYKAYKKNIYKCKNTLSWGNGYLGILYALVKCASFLNEKEKLNIYYVEIENLFSEEEFSQELNTCYGLGGVLRILIQLRKLYHLNNACFIDKYIYNIQFVMKERNNISNLSSIDEFNIRESSVFDGYMSEIIAINSLDSKSEVINIYYSLFLI